jgi:putative transposase
MYRGKRTTFKLVNCSIEDLDEINKLSATIWNDIITIANDYRVTTGNWITKTKLQSLTKSKYPCHSQSIQAVVHRYINSRSAAKEARKVDSKIRYPYKVKEYQATRWVDKSFSLSGNILSLSLGPRRKPLILEVHNLPVGEIKVVELIYDMGYRLSFLFDDLKSPKTNSYSEKASVDPGEIHAIASTCTNGNQILISTRALRSIKQYRNKSLKYLSKMQKRCKKGSKRYKKLQKAKDYILSRSNNQIKDILHKTTDQYVKWCVTNTINTVYLGDVEGVQRNTSGKRGKTKKTKRKIVS